MSIPLDSQKTRLSKNVTVLYYKRLEGQQDKQGIAKFIEERFIERYIAPMPVSCLLIEALESFRQGWPDSIGKSQLAFCNFFDTNVNFAFVHGFSQSFYKGVRCGILHQGETSGGWRIVRKGSLFDASSKTLNAKKFHDEVEVALKKYCAELREADWSEPIWKALRKKMNAVCKNCEV